MKYSNKAFTFVELIIVVTIMTILGGIGFSSYISYLGDSRDSQRKSDISQVSSSLKIYKQKRGYYALPGDYFNITYSGTTVAYQGELNTNVRLDSLERLPSDPKTKGYYTYATTKNKQEFQIASSLENEEKNIALLEGNYKSVSKNILPTIMFAANTPTGNNLEIKEGTTEGDLARKLFVFNNQSHNLVYTFEEPYSPKSDDTSFDLLLLEAESNSNFWPNSDYRNCVEIVEAGKLILPLSATSFEYQIVTDTGELVNTGCTL
ncbi:MAG: prepilin-type N-terminal cleavage/methylation domain-containing protein [Candidatus Gracilibacteria bacterium]|nr:prepilin-type N-terminal cleavage/methylation domain-containing protein [Candidatus Gracilibacteria bacterium]